MIRASTHSIGRRAMLCLALGWLGCARRVGPEAAGSLVGVTLPLRLSPAVRLAVEGQLNEKTVEVSFDVAAALTMVTRGCVEGALSGNAQVAVPVPTYAEPLVVPLVEVASLQVGPVRYSRIEVGVVAGAVCQVRLGRDRLSGVALRLELEKRQLSFVASQPKAAWVEAPVPEGAERRVVDLARHPAHDWPLVPVRVHQGAEQFIGTFVVSTSERVSRVDLEAARRDGLQPVATEDGLWVAPFDGLEVAPDFGVAAGVLVALDGQAEGAATGVVGLDVWGRFDAVLDVEAAVLVLSRPRVDGVGEAQRCLGPDGFTGDACLRLAADVTSLGPRLTVTSWRSFAEGARVHLDIEGAAGFSPCRIGVSFGPGDRGRSAQHQFPWGRLANALPACAVALRRVSKVSLGLFESGALEDCPGVCAFAIDLRTERTLCECQASPGGAGTTVTAPVVPSPPPVEAEPSDP